MEFSSHALPEIHGLDCGETRIRAEHHRCGIMLFSCPLAFQLQLWWKSDRLLGLRYRLTEIAWQRRLLWRQSSQIPSIWLIISDTICRPFRSLLLVTAVDKHPISALSGNFISFCSVLVAPSFSFHGQSEVWRRT